MTHMTQKPENRIGTRKFLCHVLFEGMTQIQGHMTQNFFTRRRSKFRAEFSPTDIRRAEIFAE